MDYITQTVENIGQRIFETEIQDFSLIGWISERGIPVGSVLGAVALLMLFAGAKCRRVLFGIQGLVVGMAGGLTAGWFLGLKGIGLLGVSAAAGIVLCVLETVFLRVGAFSLQCVRQQEASPCLSLIHPGSYGPSGEQSASSLES